MSDEARGWVRVTAVLVTYALIGIGIAAIVWGFLAAIVIATQSLTN